jgi:rsbT co-antagonist protein RsbR
VGITRDITEHREMEAASDEMQQRVIAAQQASIRKLATPIIPLMERVLVMPLIGDVDEARAKDIMRALLAGIRTHRAKVVILDVTGVTLMDTAIAGYLDRSIQGARLKGARVIVTGISNDVAETLVDLGVEWQNVQTLRNLQTGLRVALEHMGVTLEQAHRS